MLKSLIFTSIGKDLTSGNVRILILALIIAVAAVTSIGFFTDRVRLAMASQATQLLGADLLISSSRAIPLEIQEKALKEGLQVATTVTFPSVVLTDEDDSKLVSVKVVSDAYPLYGTLTTYPVSSPLTSSRVSKIPVPQTVYVDPSLHSTLSLKPDSRLALGQLEFLVAAQIDSEPDRSGSLFQLAPRVMLNMRDLDATGLLVEGSRAKYAMLIAGSEVEVVEFKRWVEALENKALEFRDASSANPQVTRILTQINKFFGLAAMIAVLLSGAAIAISARQYAANQAASGAILRAMGLDRKTVSFWILARILIMALLALSIGLLLGYLAQYVLTTLLGEWFSVELPHAGWAPVINGVAVTLLCLLGFAGLPILRAGSVPVLSVLRHDLNALSISNKILIILAIASISLMMYMQSRQLVLVIILLIGLLLMFGVFAVVGKFLYRMMRFLVPRSWPMARLVLKRRTDIAILQLSIFGFIIMTMLLIWVVRQDVMQEWQRQLPVDAPDRFLVNVQPSQLDGVSNFLQKHFSFMGDLPPVVRGRLLMVNEEDVNTRYEAGDRAQGYLHHEFNLTFSDIQPGHNSLIQGQWWSPGTDEHLLSLEEEFARKMEVGLGDRMSFQIAGIDRTATVANIRTVEWESFKVNFFAITSNSTLEDLPHTYIASFRQGDKSDVLTADLVRQNPGLTVIEVDKIIKRIRSIIDRATLAVQAVFVFTVLAGFVVLLAAVKGNEVERMHELAILRSMGASHRQLRQSVLFEFVLIGSIAGMLAACFAAIIASLIASQIMQFPIQINLFMWLYGVIGGGVLVGAAGYLACRKVLNKPPLSVLQST